MPDRVIRDELLRSHRYVNLSSDTARLLFMHFILSADDLGNAEATTTALTIMMGRHITEEVAAKLLSELADVDLIRVYQSDKKTYIHVPRFRQRLRFVKGKHPIPPANVECREIKELREKVRLKSDSSLAQDGRREEKRREELHIAASRRSPKRAIPEDFMVSNRVRSWASENGFYNVDKHFEFFVNAAKAKDYRYVDWDRAFINAMTSDWAKIGKGANPAQPKRVAL